MSIGKIYRANNLPSTARYVKALAAVEVRLTAIQRALLRAQYAAPRRTATASDLAVIIGVSSHPVVNAQYGKLGHMLCNLLGYDPGTREIGTQRWWAALSIGHDTPDGFLWELHPQVAEALEKLGWVTPPAA